MLNQLFSDTVLLLVHVAPLDHGVMGEINMREDMRSTVPSSGAFPSYPKAFSQFLLSHKCHFIPFPLLPPVLNFPAPPPQPVVGRLFAQWQDLAADSSVSHKENRKEGSEMACTICCPSFATHLTAPPTELKILYLVETTDT